MRLTEKELDEFTNLSPLKRIKRGKWLSLILVAGLITSIASLLIYEENQDQQTKQYFAEQHFLAKKCLSITSSKTDANLLFQFIDQVYLDLDFVGLLALLDDVDSQLKTGKALDEILMEEFKKSPGFEYNISTWPLDDINEKLFWFEHLLDDRYNLTYYKDSKFRNISIASILPIAQSKTLEDKDKDLRHIIILGVLGMLCAVYVLSLGKILFSKNKENMNAAIDLVKTLTGFFVGVATSLMGI